MCHSRAFTLTECLVVVAIIALLIGIFLPAMGASHRTSCGMKNSSQLRGIHQSSVVFGANNGSYLPGMNSKGALLDSTDAAFSSLAGGNTGTPGLGGGALNTRFYILLNGNFIAGDLIVSPLDTAVPGKWTNSKALPIVPDATNPAGQFSFALSNIADSATSGTVVGTRSPGRVGEWRDNANSQAILISDRNSASTTLSPRSVWATSKGNVTDWKGNLVWGDNHAEFVTSSTTLVTQYLKTTNTQDNLFTDGGLPGDNRDNAFFNSVSANY